jgi:hypothetical protein
MNIIKMLCLSLIVFSSMAFSCPPGQIPCGDNKLLCCPR